MVQSSAILEVLAGLDARLAHIDREIARLAQERKSVQAARETVNGMQGESGVGSRRRKVQRTAAGRNGTKTEKRHPILEYVRLHPGTDSGRLADHFEKITKGYGKKTPRKVVTDTIFDMVRRGKLIRDESGAIFPVEPIGKEAKK